MTARETRDGPGAKHGSGDLAFFPAVYVLTTGNMVGAFTIVCRDFLKAKKHKVVFVSLSRTAWRCL